MLHDVEGYTLVELADILDTPTGTLKSRLHRARARARELLGEAGLEQIVAAGEEQ
jgi:RNA polymerase sigma-70 factor (ECF subfamily)